MAKKFLPTIIPQPKLKTPAWLNSLFGLASASCLLVMVVAVFFQVQVSGLESKKKEVENQLAKLETKEIAALRQELLEESKKIRDFSKLFQQHKTVSRIFEFIRRESHPKVQFTTLSLRVTNEDYWLNLAGNTESFRTLGEQMLSLDNNKNISNLQLSNVSFDKEGKINFNISLSLPSASFKALSDESKPDAKPEG